MAVLLKYLSGSLFLRPTLTTLCQVLSSCVWLGTLLHLLNCRWGQTARTWSLLTLAERRPTRGGRAKPRPGTDKCLFSGVSFNTSCTRREPSRCLLGLADVFALVTLAALNLRAEASSSRETTTNYISSSFKTPSSVTLEHLRTGARSLSPLLG